MSKNRAQVLVRKCQKKRSAPKRIIYYRAISALTHWGYPWDPIAYRLFIFGIDDEAMNSNRLLRRLATSIVISFVVLFFLYFWAAFSLLDLLWRDNPYAMLSDNSVYKGNGYLINTSSCQIPDFDPWHKDVLMIKKRCHWREELPPRCTERQQRRWIFTNGSVRAIKSKSNIKPFDVPPDATGF